MSGSTLIATPLASVLQNIAQFATKDAAPKVFSKILSAPNPPDLARSPTA